MELPLVHHSPYCQTEHWVLWYTTGISAGCTDLIWRARPSGPLTAFVLEQRGLCGSSAALDNKLPSSSRPCLPVCASVSVSCPSFHSDATLPVISGRSGFSPILAGQSTARRQISKVGGRHTTSRLFRRDLFWADTSEFNFVYNFFPPLLPFFLDGKLNAELW